MLRIADVVLVPLSENCLKKEFPKKDWDKENDELAGSPLQAAGRTLAGLAPWMALGVDASEEGQLRGKAIQRTVRGLIHATDTGSADYLFAEPTRHRMVDAAFVAYSLIVAKKQLWEPLTEKQKSNVLNALKSHRSFETPGGNWVLFPAIIECAIWDFTGECDKRHIERAVKDHNQWYVGDGVYGDGAPFHWDYYNSYVIQPLLFEVLQVCRDKNDPLGDLYDKHVIRGARYAEVLEHLISPEGTFPVLGRSSTYRWGAFQHIGHYGSRVKWPETLAPGATRAALTAVIRRMAEVPGLLDEKGWLNPGVVGYQPSSKDPYNNTGALYFCLTGFAHLGMPANHPFWTEPAGKWFQQRVWSGEDVPNQKALKDAISNAR